MQILPESVVRHRAEMDADLRRVAETLWLWCPGCEELHRISTWRADGGPVWNFSGTDDRPTISPSILVGGVQWDESSEFHKPQHAIAPGGQIVCHSFVRDGAWEFLSDSTHRLAGQTVQMVPLPDWARE